MDYSHSLYSEYVTNLANVTKYKWINKGISLKYVELYIDLMVKGVVIWIDMMTL